LPKQAGRLKLLDPEVSLTALLAKWILFAIEHGITNLKILLRFRIFKMKPHPKSGFWFPSKAWLMIHKPSATRGSRIWQRIISAWKIIVKHIELLPPVNADEVLNTSLWWSTSFIGSNFNFSMDRARTLARGGMRTIGDLWDQQSLEFFSWEIISNRFPLLPLEQHHWLYLLSKIPREWLDLLRTQSQLAHRGDWLGLFIHEATLLPTIVWENQQDNNHILLPRAQRISLNSDMKVAVVHPSSKQISTLAQATDSPPSYGVIRRIRVLQLIKGRNHIHHLLFAGTVQSLSFDHGRW